MKTANAREQKCSERIGPSLDRWLDEMRLNAKAQNIQDIDELTDKELGELVNEREPKREEWTPESIQERAYESRSEAPLSVEVQRVVKIQMSWGGPSDAFYATIDADGEIEHIEYEFQDWFDGARRTLSGDDFETAKEYLGYFTEGIEQ